MSRFRWWLYKRICELAWVVCPAEHRKIIGMAYDHATDWLREAAKRERKP